MNNIFSKFQSSKNTGDFDGLEQKLDSHKFVLLLFSNLKAVTQKYLEYKFTLDRKGDDDAETKIDLSITNVVSERAFAIIKFYENRFSSLPILQASQISQSSLNNTADFISHLEFEQLEAYRSRTNEKIVINRNKGFLDKYEVIDIENKSLELHEANKSNSKITAIGRFLMNNRQFIPLDFEEHGTKFRKMVDYLKKSKEKPDFQKPGITQFLNANVYAIAELLVETDHYESSIFTNVPRTITKRYYDSVASCYKKYREAHQIVT